MVTPTLTIRDYEGVLGSLCNQIERYLVCQSDKIPWIGYSASNVGYSRSCSISKLPECGAPYVYERISRMKEVSESGVAKLRIAGTDHGKVRI